MTMCSLTHMDASHLCTQHDQHHAHMHTVASYTRTPASHLHTHQHHTLQYCAYTSTTHTYIPALHMPTCQHYAHSKRHTYACVLSSPLHALKGMWQLGPWCQLVWEQRPPPTTKPSGSPIFLPRGLSAYPACGHCQRRKEVPQSHHDMTGLVPERSQMPWDSQEPRIPEGCVGARAMHPILCPNPRVPSIGPAI